MRPLKALLISDGLPGHYHLAEGILAAIARRRPVDISRLEVRRRVWLPGRVLAALGKVMPPQAVLWLGYGLGVDSLPVADVVVSAGGNTLAANAAAARLLSVPNIFYGSLRRFRPGDFALVLTSHERFAKRPRHVMTLKPSALDPDSLPPRLGSAPNDAPRIAGLLLGGNTNTIRYEDSDWTRLLDFVRSSHARMGTRWIVSNSRRTPAIATDAIARLATAPDSPIAKFVDIASSGPGSLGELLSAAEAIFCSIDSSSMVSETVWARRPVIVVAPQRCVVPEPELEYRRYLAANNWARTIAIADLAPESVATMLAEIKPLTVNPLDELAALLEKHQPALFAD